MARLPATQHQPAPRRLFSDLVTDGRDKSVDLDNPATCVSCGCTDAQACPGGCSWLAVDRIKNTGLCSRCPV